jgi:16S rRNA processing protein RimM
LVAELVGVSDRDVALKFKGAEISIRRSDFPANKAGEYYWVDLIGSAVSNIDGVLYGNVVEVFDNGAHAVFRIALVPSLVSESSKAPQELLVPYVAQFVTTVNIDDAAAKTITVDWPLAWLNESD